MYANNGKHTRQEVVAMLAASFEPALSKVEGCGGIAKFGPVGEEQFIAKQISINKTGCPTLVGEGSGLKSGVQTREECLKAIKEGIDFASNELSSLSDIHPAWIVQALENESPKIIGIILRWLPSRHVQYIMDHLPKRVKMSLPKLVESFAVPTEIVRLIKAGFEHKFSFPSSPSSKQASFDNVSALKSEGMEVLFRDLGLHELAMAFHDSDPSGVRILLNKMSVSDARGLQQRIKDVSNVNGALLKDAKYTILEISMDQEDINALLTDIGISAFSKALKNEDMFPAMRLKMEPKQAYILKRYMDSHVGANKLSDDRQKLILERLNLLVKSEKIIL